jgi:hypothetical protein
VTEGTGKPTFPDTARPAQDQIIMCIDPLAAGEFVEQGAIQAARSAVVDVLDDSMVA